MEQLRNIDKCLISGQVVWSSVRILPSSFPIVMRPQAINLLTVGKCELSLKKTIPNCLYSSLT